MILKELFDFCSEELSFGGCGDFEALCIFEDLLGVSKEKVIFSKHDVTDEQKKVINDVIERRKNGEPLQYILGKWDFYDMSFYVGEGVLIPRPETETLVDFALEKLKGIDEPVIYDLCAGSGCIGLTLAAHIKNSKVILFEKENAAYTFLKKNKDKYNLQNAQLVKGDIFTIDLTDLPKADVILSNPPYIKSEEIPDLQIEVQMEPHTALDGGKDGLDFYRCICDKWTDKLKKDAYVAVECGENQSNDIIDIFNGKYSEKNVIFDFNDIDRIVTFRI